eukprot:TRINITY_DN22999_c0_g1_i1.p1 TRINITY_DN22999_c0_g1~~TRINITY_DN22999_c0_g1_i1.p1  ORF type:complete len:595 (-),score=60.94 TRINITY_DN22999_c0_g1_i1:272-2056(-)
MNPMLALCVGSLICVVSLVPIATASVDMIPSFRFESLPTAELGATLRSHGALAITNVPGLGLANFEALRSLSSCGRASYDGFYHKELLDGSDRWTLAGTGRGTIVPDDVAMRCAQLESNLKPLRAIVGGLGSRLLQNMDSEFGSLGPAMRHGGFRSLVTQGNAIEHFHLYHRTSNLSQHAVPLHIDKGAFLVLTKTWIFGEDNSLQESRDEAMLMEDNSSKVFSPHLLDDSAILLMGDAMKSFLGASVHVPPHAVSLRHLDVGSVRAWHGRMYMFPHDSRNDQGETARQLFTDTLNVHKNGTSIDGRARWLRGLQKDCATVEAVCWMQDPVCLERCPTGELQQCLLPDRTVGDCGPDSMNDECAFRCPATVEENSFCSPESTTSMYMQGFTSILRPGRACVVLLFRGWVLDDPFKFGFACIGVCCMGIITQGLLTLRSLVQTKTRNNRVMDSLMFGLNVVAGWAMMLIAMTYSVELFISATFGLMIGNFFLGDLSSTKILGSPCCNAVNDRAQAARTTIFHVRGMTCNACMETIERAVRSIDGVLACSGMFVEKQMTVRFVLPATEVKIMESVNAIGYDANLYRDIELKPRSLA